MHAAQCWIPTPRHTIRRFVPWRAQISRDTAIYVIRHVHNACRIIVNAGRDNLHLAPLGPRLMPILGDLHTRILGPIYRSHPDLQGAVLADVLQPQEADSSKSQKDSPPAQVRRATSKDIGRATAIRLRRALSRSQTAIMKVASESIIHAASKELAEAVQQPIVDAIAELSFASMVAYDAYPDLLKELSRAALEYARTSRTPKSDADLRKTVPPRGSVKLSDAALATVKTFMQQVRSDRSGEDQIASIAWTLEWRSKGPEDTAWINSGPGLLLGAFLRRQVPRDIIDNVDGIEIVFTADDPSMFAGKTIDFQNGQFFIRD